MHRCQKPSMRKRDSRNKPAKLDLNGIGHRVRQLRGKERQQDFAAFLGIAQGQLSKVERGKLAPSLKVLLQLRERFGKPVDWILTGKDCCDSGKRTNR